MTRDRGTYGSCDLRVLGGQPGTSVGQELIHTVSDRSRALAQISTGFRALVSDLAVWVSLNENQPDVKALAQWLASDVTPTLEEWNAFVLHEGRSWWTKLATSWDTFEQWWDRLKQLRALARAHGVMLQSVEPVPLPKTIWQQGEEGKGSEATAILGVLKIGALSALTIMGVAGLFSAIHSMRGKVRMAGDHEALRSVLREELASHKRGDRQALLEVLREELSSHSHDKKAV